MFFAFCLIYHLFYAIITYFVDETGKKLYIA